MAQNRSEFGIAAPATLIAIADQRLYKAKAQGKNCVVYEL